MTASTSILGIVKMVPLPGDDYFLTGILGGYLAEGRADVEAMHAAARALEEDEEESVRGDHEEVRVGYCIMCGWHAAVDEE